MKRIIFLSIIFVFIFSFSCSKKDSSSNNNDDGMNDNSSIDFVINNVYLRFNAVGGPNLEDCFYNLVVTDGSYLVDNSGCTPNNDIYNIIYFTEIRFDFCELINFPVEYVWLPNTSYSGMDSSAIFLDIEYQNGGIVNYINLTDDVSKSTLTFNSLNSFSFKIELFDGRIIQKNYSGNIINVSSEDGCSLSL